MAARPVGTTGSTVTSNHSRSRGSPLTLSRSFVRWACHTVVGHDFGSPIAAWCGLTRPDVFRSCVMMSAPYRPAPPVGSSRRGMPKFVGGLAELERPRKHYVWYYSTPEANDDMRNSPQGISDFLRAYFHVKSGDWSGNRSRSSEPANEHSRRRVRSSASPR